MATGPKTDKLAELEARLRTLLPDTYEVFDEEVQPVSMGSAGLKYGADGRVLWHEMWGSFCDLAMAGGPPHRGTFLEPATKETALIQSSAYSQVADEICRGVLLVTGLYAEPSRVAGWVQMYCTSAAMTGWLMRAIVMENVCAIGHGLVLNLPTGSTFRIEKEIKNVITAVAKTCHYWQDHMSDAKHDEIAELLAAMQRENPLVYPPAEGDPHAEERSAAAGRMARDIAAATGLRTSYRDESGWLRFDCETAAAAIWMMRALSVYNVLARREQTQVFVPVDAAQNRCDQTVSTVIEVHHLACLANVFSPS